MFGEKVDIELCENGASMQLIKDNREQFVELYVDYEVNKSIAEQFAAFKSVMRREAYQRDDTPTGLALKAFARAPKR